MDNATTLKKTSRILRRNHSGRGFVELCESVSDALAIVAGILHDVKKAGIVLRRHRGAVLSQFAYGSRIFFRGNMIFGNQTLFF